MDFDNGLVSIISPCYNGEKYVGRFLESVLNQDYPKIELIIVNDCSTDKSEEIIISYKKRFLEKGYRFIYLKQDVNMGQAAAINRGLPIFTGEYLMWPDSDDILARNNVSDKVKYLEKHSDIGFVMAQGEIVYDINVDKVEGVLKRLHKNDDENELFYDFINVENVFFVPVAFIVRRQTLIECIPDLRIYESREGQNWQFLLPLSYKAKCGYIDYPLFKYVIHYDSHSHIAMNYERKMERIKNFDILITKTLEKMPFIANKDLTDLLEYVHIKFLKEQLNISLEHKKFNDYFRLRRKYIKTYGNMPLSMEIPFVYICKIIKRWHKSIRKRIIVVKDIIG